VTEVDILNEKRKLYATYFNNIGVAIFAIGMVGPLFKNVLVLSSDFGNLSNMGYIIMVLGLSVFFHGIGRSKLEELE